jgi:vitamin B12 transporter
MRISSLPATFPVIRGLASATAAALAMVTSTGISAQAASGDRSAAGGELDEIVVTSSRIPMPLRQIGTAVSVITGADIDLRGYTSMADILRTQPGIAVTNTGGLGKTTSLRVRGEEGYRTTLMIDGVKIADPTGPQISPDFDHLLTTSDLARVEVLRGPQGFIYGADAGGVVNILTRSGEGETRGQVGLELGDFGTSRYDGSVSGGGAEGDYFFSATHVDSDGFNTQVADTVLADKDGYRNTTLHAKLGWNATENLRLQLVARDVDGRTQYDGCGFPAVYDCVGTVSRTVYRVSADQTKGKLGNLFAYSSMDVANRDFATGVSSFATNGSISHAEYTGNYKPTESTTFVYGLDLERDDMESEGEKSSREQNSVYFEYQGQLTDRFFVSAGARHDDNDDFGTHTSSRVTAAYVTDLAGGASLKYRASVGTGFRAPSLYEIAYNAGPFSFPPASGLALAEETSSGYDLGIDFAGPRGLTAEVTYFNQTIDDAIEFDLAAFSGYLQTAGESGSRGIEAALDIPLGERWGVLANLTYNDTEDAAGRQRVRRPRNYGNFGLRYSSADAKLRLLANYRYSRDSMDEVFGVGRIPLDDYQVLDFSASYDLSDIVELYLRAENLTDEDYQEVAGFNSAPRAAWVGARFSF